VHRKLAIGQANDPLEHEADRIADQVTQMPEPAVQRECACFGIRPGSISGRHRNLQLKREGSGHFGSVVAPPIVHDALRSSGQPLDSATRAYFEPRFGHDFGNVRVHLDALAARSADAVHANAYTVGRELVFARDRYSPHSDTGRRLLAHELAHVVQQHGEGQGNVLRRAEVDDRSCSSLKDSEADINAFVNKEIDDERKAMTPPLFGPLLAMRVMQQLGGRSPISPIETFIEGLPATKRTLPPNDLSGTKYSGAGSANNFYQLQAAGIAHVVGSVAKVHGICIGADKLGHFFDQGWDFSEAAKKPGSKPQDVTNLGLEMEIGQFGLASTGVFSNADLAANEAGMKFYRDLEKNPSKFKFQIGKYITAKWNEQVNPSFYESNLASVVWSNLLTGPWAGTLTPPATRRPIKTTFDLQATTSGTVTGSFELDVPVSAGSSNTVTIKNGKITQKTTALSTSGGAGPPASASPVSGVSIEFDWERGVDTGKGRLDSIDEQTLTGTLGSGTSAAGSGTFKFRKA
jgi:hypothetical protein